MHIEIFLLWYYTIYISHKHIKLIKFNVFSTSKLKSYIAFNILKYYQWTLEGKEGNKLLSKCMFDSRCEFQTKLSELDDLF